MAPPKSVAIEVVIQAKPYKLFVDGEAKLKNEEDKEVVSVIGEPPTLQIIDPNSGNTYVYDKFDGVFNGSKESFEEIYEAHIEEKVNFMFDGVSSTVFAYGQTNSGKTHTITKILNVAAHGLLKRATAEEKNVSFTCVELYNNKISDLLEDSEKAIKVKTNDRTSLTYFDCAEGIRLLELTAFQRAMRAVEKKRHKAETNMNARSSRSHLIVSFLIHDGDFEPQKAKGKLNIIDLAGNESISEAGTDAKQDRRQETGSINLSLSRLKLVIEQLNQRKVPVPYRGMKLTEFLSDSLGGTARTLVIGCIAPNSGNLNQTFRTLNFCEQARSVINKVRAIDTSQVPAEELRKLLTESQLKLNQLQSNNPLTQKNKNLQKEVDKLRKLVKQHADSIAELEQRIGVRDAEIEELAERIRKLHTSIADTERINQDYRKDVEVREKKLKKRAADVEIFRTRIDELEKQELELRTKIEARESNLEEASQADELRSRITELEEESDELRMSVEEKDSKLEELAAKSDEMHARITELEEEARELRKRPRAMMKPLVTSSASTSQGIHHSADGNDKEEAQDSDKKRKRYSKDNFEDDLDKTLFHVDPARKRKRF